MARRKNVKRIDPRYFLHETVARGEGIKEGAEDDIAAVIEYAVQKAAETGISLDRMPSEEVEQIFTDIQDEKTYADRDVEAAYKRRFPALAHDYPLPRRRSFKSNK